MKVSAGQTFGLGGGKLRDQIPRMQKALFSLARCTLLVAAAWIFGNPGASRGQTPGDPVAPQWSPAALLNWDPATDADAPYNRSSVPLATRTANTALNVNPHAQFNGGGVMPLVAFNRWPVSSAQGPRSLNFYPPQFWQYMDSFVFWGGSNSDGGQILTPNGHVIDAAHRNGVPIYGKVFFGPQVFGGNIAYVNAFLQKSGNTFPVADKMIQAAQYFGFDGWFINQETEGADSNTASAMQAFMTYFRTKAPTLKLIWYDSMDRYGNISYQNALNSNNQAYFQSGNTTLSDKMFLNFWWGQYEITSSRANAISLGRNPYDLYAGIDTEGSGYNASVPWTYLFPETTSASGSTHVLSLGIYRPEWTFNSSSGTADFLTREGYYWVGKNQDPSRTSSADAWPGLAHYYPAQTAINSLPFVTNFNIGQGSIYNINGTTLMTDPWSCLSLQDFLPTWRWIVTSTSANKLTPALVLDDAYYGGSSLRFTGTLDGVNTALLYQTNLPVSASTQLRVVYKAGIANDSAMQVGLTFADAPSNPVYLPLGTAAGTTSWTTATLNLSPYAGKTIAALSLRFVNSGTQAGYSMRVGRIAIVNGAATVPAAPTDVVLAQQNSVDPNTVSVRLKWTPSTSSVYYYNVYVRYADNTTAWVAGTPNTACFVPLAHRKGTGSTISLEVEAVAPDFSASASRAAISVTLPPPPNTKYPLAGTVIGTPGAYNGGTSTRDKVFDGNTATFFDGPDVSGDWAGLDLGITKSVTAINYFPRAGYEGRMVGGVFQGSNTADFSSGVVTLYTVPSTPSSTAYTLAAVTNYTGFRYLRYLGPTNGSCNVAEVVFYGVSVPAAPAGVNVSMLNGTASLSWSAPTYANTYNVKRAASSGGAYTTVASNVTATSYSDSGLALAGTYYYMISAANEAGESANSVVVQASDAYQQWAQQNGLTPGATGSGFGETPAGAGASNGVRYAVPDGLTVTPGANAATLTFVLRTDAALRTTLQVSPDLQTWSVSSANIVVSSDQSGVAAGFKRMVIQDTGAAAQRFYRLQLSR